MRESTFQEKLTELQMVIFDVDGVLTDGRLHYGPNGEELKVFHSLDGHGLKELMRNNIQVAIISGRDCQALRVRLSDLGITHAYLGKSDKRPAFEDLLEKTGLSKNNIAYMGDDIPDLAPMQEVAIGFAPANAISAVLDQADWVSSKTGGLGAVREVCDLILNTRL